MAGKSEKRVSVRLATEGGKRVIQDLEEVGEAGEAGFARLKKEAEAASVRLEGMFRKVRLAAVAATAAAAAGAAALVNAGLSAIDAQAKLAQSLGTTVESIQVLERAGSLAGVAMSGVEQATKDLTRRLSQAASGTGPAADALKRLGLTAGELMALPLDQRVAKINQAILDFVPATERAAVAGKLFGEEGAIAMARIDPATLEQATRDVRDFGVAVSDVDADGIERANDAISRLGLVSEGIRNQLTVALAPALEAAAEALAEIGREVVPAVASAIRALSENMGRLASAAAVVATWFAGRWVAAMAAAALSVRGLATAYVILKGAIIRTGIGVLIVAAGELVYQFTRLVRGAGGFGEAMKLLGDVAAAVWTGMGTRLSGFADGFRAMGEDIQAAWLRVMRYLSEKWADFLGRVAPTFNSLPSLLRGGLELDPLGAAAFASSYDGAIARAEAAARRFREGEAAKLAGAFDGALDAVEALREVLAKAGEEGEASLSGVAEALAEIEAAAAAAGGGADKTGEDGKDGKPTKAKTAKAKTGLDKVRESGDALRATLDQVRSAGAAAFTGMITGAQTAQQSASQLLGQLSSLAANKAFNALFNAAAGALTSALFGGFVAGTPLPGGGSVPAAATGFASMPLYADGTDDHPGGLAMVGERGREIVNLPRGAQVVDAITTSRVLGGAGQETDVRIFFDRDQGWQAEVMRISKGVSAQVYDAREPATRRKALADARRANAEQKFR